MNCSTIRDTYLETVCCDGGQDLSADLRSHMVGCPACSRWVAQLVDLDTDLANLPILEPAGGRSSVSDPEPEFSDAQVPAKFPKIPDWSNLNKFAPLRAGSTWRLRWVALASSGIALAAGVVLAVTGVLTPVHTSATQTSPATVDNRPGQVIPAPADASFALASAGSASAGKASAGLDGLRKSVPGAELAAAPLAGYSTTPVVSVGPLYIDAIPVSGDEPMPGETIEPGSEEAAPMPGPMPGEVTWEKLTPREQRSLLNLLRNRHPERYRLAVEYLKALQGGEPVVHGFPPPASETTIVSVGDPSIPAEFRFVRIQPVAQPVKR